MYPGGRDAYVTVHTAAAAGLIQADAAGSPAHSGRGYA
jgi:hypothetical protein